MYCTIEDIKILQLLQKIEFSQIRNKFNNNCPTKFFDTLFVSLHIKTECANFQIYKNNISVISWYLLHVNVKSKYKYIYFFSIVIHNLKVSKNVLEFIDLNTKQLKIYTICNSTSFVYIKNVSNNYIL